MLVRITSGRKENQNEMHRFIKEIWGKNEKF